MFRAIRLPSSSKLCPKPIIYQAKPLSVFKTSNINTQQCRLASSRKPAVRTPPPKIEQPKQSKSDEPFMSLKLEEFDPDNEPATSDEIPNNVIGGYYTKCQDKLKFVPNIIRAYSFNPMKFINFVDLSNNLMLNDKSSNITKLEREMIATVVSSLNRCYYCIAAHGAAVRKLSKDPTLGEALVMNYKMAEITDKQRAMLDFVTKLTTSSHLIEERDRDALREQGFTEEDIWDIVEVTGFYNMSNRIASGIGLIPNKEYHPSFRRPEDFQQTQKKQEEQEEEPEEEEAEEEEVEEEEEKPVVQARKPAPKQKPAPKAPSKPASKQTSKSEPASSKKAAQKPAESGKRANPYIIFVKEKLPTLNDMPKSEAMKEIGKLWQGLSAQEKKVYQDKAAGNS